MKTVPIAPHTDDMSCPLTTRPLTSAPSGPYAIRPLVGPAEVWSRDDMRAACAQRDVAHVFKILNSAGVSQRRIAAATGQSSQSEVSEILNGRQVRSVELLERIADGLGCPRSWWGLSHDVTSAGYADDLARRAVRVAAENARQLATTAATLAAQVVTLLDTLDAASATPAGGSTWRRS